MKKSTKKSKRHRRSPFLDEYDSKYGRSRSSKDTLPSSKLVEYSDVSSEDFSAPEAGEIQDEEVVYSFSDRDCQKWVPPMIVCLVPHLFCVWVDWDRILNASNSYHYSNGSTTNRNNASSSATGSVIDIDNSKLSSTPSRKLEVGSPISSSLSSHSRTKVSISSHHHRQVNLTSIIPMLC